MLDFYQQRPVFVEKKSSKATKATKAKKAKTSKICILVIFELPKVIGQFSSLWPGCNVIKSILEAHLVIPWGTVQCYVLSFRWRF